MILTFVPCVDAYASDTDCYSTIQQYQEHNHSGNTDVCSPFCFCACCQLFSQLEFPDVIKFNQVALSIIAPMVENNYSNPIIPFWRPPKI